MSIINLATRHTVQSYHHQSGAVLAIAWSPDGAQIASGGVDHQAFAWDLGASVAWPPPAAMGVCTSGTLAAVAIPSKSRSIVTIKGSVTTVTWSQTRVGLCFRGPHYDSVALQRLGVACYGAVRQAEYQVSP